jgi:murein DD-endopeptidase MepM/ murein hydrolase activator NlpD
MPQAHILIVTQNVKIVTPLLRILGGASFRRWALALVLPFFGVVAAFGIAPDTVTDDITRSLVVEDVSLPQPPAVTEAQRYWHEERIQRGDTLARVIARLKVNDAEAMAFINSAPEARALFQLVPGRAMRAETDADGKLLALHYPNGEQVLALTRDGETFSVENTMAEVETRTVSVTGVIRSSLFAATDALNIPDAVAVQLVELFSTEIDFHKDLRKNDRFSVVYEARYDHGEPVGAGRVLSAEFVNQGRTLNVVWFETQSADQKNKAGGAYYTLDGRDIRKAFLRSPLEFSRVSSGFTDARYHPILNTWTAHKGVDFVAPLGTKIKATADGVVEFAGVQSGYGNVVILRHHKKYTTLYAHMSGFAPDIKVGAKVQQGDVLGNVGMTGLTTGPHVHFEFRIDDVHYDPQSIAMPTALPIEPELKQQFLQASAPMARTLRLLRDAAPSSTFE